MRKLVLISIFITSYLFVFSDSINLETATQVANNFFGISQTRSTSNNLKLVYEGTNNLSRSSSTRPYYYVFNRAEDKGFVIISADDVIDPIIGYSETGTFKANNIPDNFKEWMDGVCQTISNVNQNNNEADSGIQEQWENYLTNNIDVSSRSVTQSVAPLIKTQWGQSRPYNKELSKQLNVEYTTGCVATAASQIMKYYSHPKAGIGNTPSYITAGQQVPSYDLSKIYFDWNNMLNQYSGYYTGTTQQHDAVSKLMYYFGVSSGMNYTTYGSDTGIGAGLSVLVYNFYYTFSENALRQNYTETEWINLMKRELDNKRPIFCSGSNGTDHHAFICDGYDSRDYLHFNWGWSGEYDGYYNTANNLFNKGQTASLGLTPRSYDPNFKSIGVLDIYVDYNKPYKLSPGGFFTLNLGLNGNIKQGYYRVALTDYWGNLVYYLTDLIPLKGEYFYDSVLCKLPYILQGSYFVKIEYKEGDNMNWVSESKKTANSSMVSTTRIKMIDPTQDDLEFYYFYLNDSPYLYPGEQFTIGNLVFLKHNLYERDAYEYKFVLRDQSYNIKSDLSPGLNLAQTEVYYTSKIPYNITPGFYNITGFYKLKQNNNWKLMPHHFAESARTINIKVLSLTESKTRNISDMSGKDNEIQVYPNPVSDVVNIVSTNGDIEQCIIYDSRGSIVKNSLSREKEKTIQMNDLSSGIYILKVKVNDKVVTSKINKL